MLPSPGARLITTLALLGAGVAYFYFTRPVSHSSPGSSAAPSSVEAQASPRGDSAPQVSSPAASAVEAGSAEEAQAKVKVLNEILTSRNDNDPRLDSDFKSLTAADKQALRERYESLPAEGRNQRGTIVFLLGRNLTSPEDFQFLESVLREKPCLNPQDCSKPMGPDRHEDEHGGGQIRLVLAYPQIVALKAIESGLSSSGSPGFRQNAEKVIATGEASPIPEVSELARSLRAESK